MAGISMVTRTAVFTPSGYLPRTQQSPSPVLSARSPSWSKSRRVAFSPLCMSKSTSDEAKESVDSAASAVSKKAEEGTDTVKDFTADTKAAAEKNFESASSKAGEVGETLKDAAGTAAEKAKKDVGGAWDAAKATTDKVVDQLSGN